MSQEEFCERIGFSRGAYSAIESGKRDGRQSFWVALQKAFDIPDAEMWNLKKNE
jgi:transcriptional regulator with XRE-family HTH domain